MLSAKLYVTCPNCGKKLCRAVRGSEVDAECPKCHKLVLIQINTDGAVSTKVDEPVPTPA